MAFLQRKQYFRLNVSATNKRIWHYSDIDVGNVTISHRVLCVHMFESERRISCIIIRLGCIKYCPVGNLLCSWGFRFSSRCQVNRVSVCFHQPTCCFSEWTLNNWPLWNSWGFTSLRPGQHVCMRHRMSTSGWILGCKVYPKKYAHGFVVLCFVVVMQSFIINSHEVFIHIHQGCFAGTGSIVRLPQCQWSKPDGYGKISQCITTTKHSKAKTVCIFLGIYCIKLQTGL